MCSSDLMFLRFRRLGRFKRRQGRRLQRSVETVCHGSYQLIISSVVGTKYGWKAGINFLKLLQLAVLSEIEQREEDFDVSFSLDELGETSERVCATFHASVNLGHIKGNRRMDMIVEVTVLFSERVYFDLKQGKVISVAKGSHFLIHSPLQSPSLWFGNRGC